ncbi:class I glutamine amidotransferase-like protein [Ilyonectria sp. MPI-CAGE-AT-0026]|nr:class I glutamine amidotransferase-like protein [Ilyonectria sp. MPI-CAGE-AT-0026]
MAFANLLRVAVLRCFAIPDQIAQERGQFDAIFATWIQAAVKTRNNKRPASDQVVAEVKGWDVVGKRQYPDLTEVDVLIVTGSTASAYDDEPWIHQLSDFLRDVYANHPLIKIFGGCFGHQIISHALLGSYGVRVEKNPAGWEIGVHQVDLSSEFSSQFPDVLNTSKVSYQFLHGDHVVTKEATLPRNWIEMGSSSLCAVQGLLDPGRVLTIQGHPEFDRFINGLSTSSLGDSGAISKERLDGFLKLVDQEDNADLVGEVTMEFVCQPTMPR